MGCGVYGPGLRVEGLGFRVQGSGFKAWGLGFGVWGSRFEFWGLPEFSGRELEERSRVWRVVLSARLSHRR